jgi:surface protein
MYLVRSGEDVTKVNTSEITDMSHMFYVAKLFNQDISNWDVSNVTDMSHI